MRQNPVIIEVKYGTTQQEWQIDVLNLQTTTSHPLNPFKPEFTIVIFIHYKPRIAVAILDL